MTCELNSVVRRVVRMAERKQGGKVSHRLSIYLSISLQLIIVVESNTFSQLPKAVKGYTRRWSNTFCQTHFNPGEIHVQNTYQITEQNVATKPKRFVTQIFVIMRVIVAAEDGRK